ncbi:hypothetical protein TNCV_5030181 [Trichonephila clavipes]|nr:hypothetical protein TNCV_5030181 [Trichonephila clavipes]
MTLNLNGRARSYPKQKKERKKRKSKKKKAACTVQLLLCCSSSCLQFGRVEIFQISIGEMVFECLLDGNEIVHNAVETALTALAAGPQRATSWVPPVQITSNISWIDDI